jgi:isocitrate dehydrogenase
MLTHHARHWSRTRYHNPLDNVPDLARHFFQRCLDESVTPYVVTKKTVFKWQESFWTIMKDVFDAEYADRYRETDLLDRCGGDLTHLISDAATMQIIRWTGGGFGMAAHNYDGDMLTDEISQVHRSPGFITSNLVGKRSFDGVMIKEFEASHGTVTDLYEAHLRGEETSMNPLGMVEALIGAMQHAAVLEMEAGTGDESNHQRLMGFTSEIRRSMHECMRRGEGTRDLCGSSGLTTEGFIEAVGLRLDAYVSGEDGGFMGGPITKPGRSALNVDTRAIKARFDKYDLDGNGTIDFNEFTAMMVELGIAPTKNPPSSASIDKPSTAD